RHQDPRRRGALPQGRDGAQAAALLPRREGVQDRARAQPRRGGAPRHGRVGDVVPRRRQGRDRPRHQERAQQGHRAELEVRPGVLLPGAALQARRRRSARHGGVPPRPRSGRGARGRAARGAPPRDAAQGRRQEGPLRPLPQEVGAGAREPIPEGRATFSTRYRNHSRYGLAQFVRYRCRMFRWSLRAMLLAGMGGILLGGAAVSVLTSERVLRAADDRRAAVVRHDMIAASARARLLGLVDQEVGLRGYLATGDRRLLQPYETGRTAARDARLQLARPLLDGERERVSKLLDDVDDATADWITAYASPQIWAREKGPIQALPAAFIEGKRLFERVRAAHAELSDVLRDISEAAIARADRLIQEARLIGHGVTALVFVLGLWIMRAFLRRTAGPLAELERKASAREPFAAPGAGVKVREVAGLQQALHDLDRTARERERARAQAHA